MVRWIVFCSFIFSLVLTLIGVALDVVFLTNYKPELKRWHQVKADRLETYMEEKAYFENHSFFARVPETQADFADYLSPRMAPEKNAIFVPLKRQREILSYEEKWMEKRNRTEIPQMISELFTRALDYDHWDIQKTLKEKPDLKASEFVAASQILLAGTVREDQENYRDNLQKVRHMAMLLMTCEDLNFNLAALSLLNKEKEFTTFVHKRLPAKNVEWIPIAAREIDRYRDFLYMTYDYLDFLSTAGTLEKIFMGHKLPTGFCSVYGRRAPILFKASYFMKSSFPFEPAFLGESKAFRQIAERANQNCRTKRINSKDNATIVSHIPFYRRIVGLRFLLSKKSMNEGS